MGVAVVCACAAPASASTPPPAKLVSRLNVLFSEVTAQSHLTGYDILHILSPQCGDARLSRFDADRKADQLFSDAAKLVEESIRA